MKKNFFKKLAAGLALAMVVTSVAPAANVSAAAAKITGAPSTVYVTKAYKLKLGNNVKATWKSSNKKVSTVGLTGGVLKPVAPGKVTVTAKSKVTGKSYKKTFTVKQRATSVELGDDLSLAVGETAQLDAKKTPATSTDVIRYFSDNKEVATVGMTGGKVTANKAGEATITVYSKATTASATASKMNKVDTIKVKVGTFIESAAQDTLTKLAVNFNTDMKDVKAADFKIVRDDTNQEFAIKGVSADGKKVTVETYSEINDGATYTVTYGENSYKFVASDGKISTLAIAPTTITYNKETEIKLLAKDVNGVTVKEVKYGDSESNYDFDIETDNGYTTDSKLVLNKVGDTAKATATYHTFEYDSNGNETGAIKTEATITAVEESAFDSNSYKYTIDTEAPSWNDFTQNTKIAINDDDRKIFVQLKDKNGEEVNYENYYLASSNEDILVVNDDADDDALTADVRAVDKAGSAYVLVKNNDDKVVLSLPVTIIAERKTSNLVLSESSVRLSNAFTDEAKVKVTVKDQFGDDVDVESSDVKIETTSTPKGDKLVNEPAFEDGKLVFASFDGATLGTYKYKVTVDDRSKTISLSVQEPKGDEKDDSYKYLVSEKTADVVVKNDNTQPFDIEIRVAKVAKNGVVRQYVDFDKDAKAFEKNKSIVFKLNGDVVTESAYTVSGDVINFKALSIDSSNDVTKADKGNYTFKFDFVNVNGTEEDTVKGSGSFKIEDSQSGLKAVREKNKVDASSFEETITEAFKFYYKGNDVTDDIDVVKYELNSKKDAQFETGKTYSFKNVKVTYKIGSRNVPFTVDLNKSVTVND